MKEFYIDKDGFRLHTKLDFPEGNFDEKQDKIPLVIVVHGLTGHMEERHIIAVAKAANEAGFAALRVELYGHGKSDGQFKNHTIMEWVSELLYVIDYAESLDFVTDIYLMGHSQGGLSIMLTAAMKKDVIKAILPLSPALVIKDACISGNFFNIIFDPEYIPAEIKAGEMAISGNYIRVGQLLPIDWAIANYDGKVLLVHGTEDEAVPYAYSVKAEKEYKNAKLVTIPDDNHCYDRHLDMVTEAVKQFLTEIRND
jgi:hypothetical protein